jgi:hypothetical protein
MTDLDTENMRKLKCRSRQSKHKNVFKNFGNAIIRFCNFHPIFLLKINDYFKNNLDLSEKFKTWLKK